MSTGSREADKRKAQEQTRNPLARAATWASALLVLALATLLVLEGLRSDTPPAFAVRVLAAERLAGEYHVPVLVQNSGGQSVQGLQVSVRLSGPAGTVAESDLVFDWLPAHSGRQGTVIFAVDPAGYRLETRIEGYTLP